jgi:hypothetical protein
MFNFTNRPQEFYGHGKNIINVIIKIQIPRLLIKSVLVN